MKLFSLMAKRFRKKISVEKLLSFYYKNVSTAENYLQVTGYEFRKKQTSELREEVRIYWDYKTKDLEYFVYLSVDTFKHLITSISYEFYSKNEFIEIMNTIPKLNFDDTRPLKYRENGTDKEFIRDDVNILLSTTKYDADKFHYSLSICHCLFPNQVQTRPTRR